MDTTLESRSKRLRRYKSEIERYEERTRLGRRVNRYRYQQAIDNHNALVAKYNALVAERNVKLGELKQEVATVNAMVNRYNRGER